MARVCQICGKSGRVSNTIVRHGLPKKKGGIGLHTTGVTRRRQLPNLHRVRARVDGAARRVNVCAACIKAGKIVKP